MKNPCLSPQATPDPSLVDSAVVQLRAEAESRLCSACVPYGSTVSTDTLALLYELAKTPERAGEALKLLHELQVHQEELALQREELERSGAEAVCQLAWYETFYQLAPLAGWVVDGADRIVDVNVASARLFGSAELLGHAAVERVVVDSRAAFQAVLRQARSGDATATATGVAEVDLGGESGRRSVRVVARRAGCGENVVVCLLADSALPAPVE